MSSSLSSPSSGVSAASSHLNDTHRAQVAQYAAFFHAKRDENAKEIDALFDEQKDMRLLEEMYPVDEVSNILDGVRSLVRSQVVGDWERLTQQSLLYLRQLFLQAEGNGVAINVDLSTLDDAVLLSGIEKLDLKSKAGDAFPDASRRAGSLAPVGGSVDVRLVTQVKELQEANRSLLAKFEKLQQQCTGALKEGSELRERNAELERALQQAQSDLANLQSSNRSAQQAEIESLRAQLAAEKAEAATQLAAARAEAKSAADTLNAKVSASPQYAQLKKLMNTKNEQLKESRARVKQLEEHLNKQN